MAHQGLCTLPTVHIPYEALSALSPAATRGQPTPIRAPGHAPEQGRLHTIGPPQGVCGHIPYLHATLIGAAGQQLSVWTPRHAKEEGVSGVGVLNDLETGAQGWVPQPDSTIPPGTCEQAPIRTPCHAVDLPAMAAQRAS